MGKRSRKRVADPEPSWVRGTAAVPAPPAPRTVTWKADRADAPRAPWAPFPLNELCILLGLVALVAAVVAGAGPRPVLLVAGLALASLGSAELALREHLAGFRSHSTLLAGAAAILVAVPLWLSPLPTDVLPVAGVAVFALAHVRLRRAFRARSGGVGFRV
jgi:hypothetical protein